MQTPSSELQAVLHQTIKKVSEDIVEMKFNTAISAMMILVNEMEKEETIEGEDFSLFLKLLAPFAPHITEEIWQSPAGAKAIRKAFIWRVGPSLTRAK
jgi:leucyl-tRNA synthetase